MELPSCGDVGDASEPRGVRGSRSSMIPLQHTAHTTHSSHDASAADTGSPARSNCDTRNGCSRGSALESEPRTSTCFQTRSASEQGPSLILPSGNASELGLKLLDGGETVLEILRKRLDDPRGPLGYTDRLVDVAKRILDEHLVLFLAEQQADLGPSASWRS